MTSLNSASSPTPQTAPDRSARRIMLVVLTIAFAARFAMLLYANAHPARFDYPDSHRYAAVARNIASGLGPIESPTNRTGTDPLYPLLLAPATVWFDASLETTFAWARIVNLALGLAAVAAVTAIARLIAGNTAALVAGLITALDPTLLFFHGLVLTEVPFIAFLWTALYLLFLNRRRPSPVRGALAGLLLGCATLTRSSGLPLALVLPLLAIPGAQGLLRHRIAVSLFTLAGALVALYPAAIRNHRLINTWLPLSTGGGATLLDSFSPRATGGSAYERITWPAVPPNADERARDRIFRDAALDWAKSHPLESLKLAAAKFARTWSITFHAPGYTGWTFALIGALTVAPIYLLALAGLITLRHRRSTLLLLITPALYFALLHMFFIGSVRYRQPAMPALFILAACAIAAWHERRQSRASSASAGASR